MLLMGAGWLRRRQRVGERTGVPEDRRFFNLMYTDDALFGAVGIDATLNLLREWRGVTSEAGLIMAIPKKREIGTCVGAPAGLQVVREPVDDDGHLGEERAELLDVADVAQVQVKSVRGAAIREQAMETLAQQPPCLGP